MTPHDSEGAARTAPSESKPPCRADAYLHGSSATSDAVTGEVVDLFAGPGGWDVAAQQLGIDPLGIEHDEAACLTREAAGLRTLRADVAHPPLRADMPICGLIASPPCQTFSMAGKGAGRDALDQVLRGVQSLAMGEPIAYAEYEDVRTGLVLEPLAWALRHRPEWLAWEQVPTVLPVWQACAEVLRTEGYSVAVGVVSAEEYGVPQTRKRAVLVASRTRAVSLPAATHTRYRKGHPREDDSLAGLLPWVSMADALGRGMTDRPYPTIACARSTGGPDMEKVGGSTARAAIYTELAAGRWVLRNNTSANAATRTLDEPAPTLYFGQRMNGVYWLATGTRPNAPLRHENEPAPTLAFGHDAASHVWVVPDGDGVPDIARMKRDGLCVRLSLEDAGVLQSFPLDYPWQGNASKRFQQVGNAIPPLLAQHVLAAATGLAVAIPSEVAA